MVTVSGFALMALFLAMVGLVPFLAEHEHLADESQTPPRLLDVFRLRRVRHERWMLSFTIFFLLLCVGSAVAFTQDRYYVVGPSAIFGLAAPALLVWHAMRRSNAQKRAKRDSNGG